MAGHAQLKFVMTECSKTQIRLENVSNQINVIVPLISSSERYICSKFKNGIFFIAVMFYFNKGSGFKIKINVRTWASLF